MYSKLTNSQVYFAMKTVKRLLFILIVPVVFSACSVTPGNPTGSDDNTTSQVKNEALSGAVAAMKAGNMKNAKSLLLDLLNKQPNLANAHVNLGIVYIKTKSFDEAENSLNRALAINPNNIYALNQIGFLYRRQGKFDEARKSYEKAIAVKSDYANAHLNLAILYDLYMYKLDKAIEHYEIYKELVKEDAKQTEKWIFELKNRQKKSLAQK